MSRLGAIVKMSAPEQRLDEASQLAEQGVVDSALHYACDSGWLDTVTTLVEERGHDVMVASTAYGQTPLHIACRKGDLEMVKFLVRQPSCQVSARDHDGSTPLHIACQYGKLAVVQFLASNENCEINAQDKRGNTALHKACGEYHTGVVEYLIDDQKCDVNCQNDHGETPLLMLCHRVPDARGIRIMQLLLSSKHCDINLTSKSQNTPLHAVCGSCNVEACRLLLAEESCDVNAQNSRGETPLIIASRKGCLDVVKLLVSMKACDFKCQNRFKDTALDSACEYGHLETTKFLLGHTKGIVEVKRPLQKACKYGKTNIVEFFLRNGICDVNSQFHRKATLLHEACCKGDLSMVTLLIGIEKCDINCKDDESCTPLHIACSEKDVSIDVIRSLIKCGQRCDVNCRDREKRTPLLLAAKRGLLQVCKVLVMEGHCDINLPDRLNRTPLHFACESPDCVDVVKFLIGLEECQVNCYSDCASHGGTPLHMACREGVFEIVVVLTSSDRCRDQLNHPDAKGNTPLHLACSLRDAKIAQFLADNEKCDINVQNHLKQMPLHVACKSKYKASTKIVESLLNCGRRCDADIRAGDGSTALIQVCEQRAMDKIRLLVGSENCDVNCTDTKGDTALHKAVTKGKLEVVEVLVNAPNCDINARRSHFYGGQTALHLACWSEKKSAQFDLVKILLHCEKRCDVNCQESRDGFTTLHMAARGGKLEICKLLVAEMSCDLDIKDSSTWTPLHHACKEGQLEVCKLLASQSRCDCNCETRSHETPLDIASYYNRGKNEEMVKFLRSRATAADVTIYNVHSACKEGEITNVTNFVKNLGSADGNVTDVYQDTLLHIACREGHTRIVGTLLEHEHTDVNLRNEHGRTPLHEACSSTKDVCIEIVQAFIKSRKSFDINCRDSDGCTPVHYACRSNNLQLCKFLVSEGSADVNVSNENQCTPLHLACQSGSMEVVGFLTTVVSCDVNAQDSQSNTPLHVACSKNDYPTVQILTGCERCHVNSTNKEGNTPLHIACSLEDPDISTLLIQNKQCQLNIQSQSGQTPLHVACVSRHRSASAVIVRSLLGSGSDCGINCKESESGKTSLHRACENENKEICQLLLNDDRCDPNCYNKGVISETPLHTAVGRENTEITKLFLKSERCDVNCRNSNGKTPLHLAMQIENLELVKLLLGHKHCAIDGENWQESTPLQSACESTNSTSLKVVEILLSSGKPYDLNRCDQTGRTFLHHASEKWRGNLDILELLINQDGTELNRKDHDEEAPIHIACRRGNTEVLKLLVQSGKCDINRQNNAKSTPLHIATKKHHGEIVQLLVSREDCEINCQNDDGLTPLEIACGTADTTGSIEVAQILLQNKKCDLNFPDKGGRTVLHKASAWGKLNLVRLLLEQERCSVSCEDNEGKTPLHLAIESSCSASLPILQAILECKQTSAISYTDRGGNTPLHYAAAKGDPEVVKYMLSTGKFNPNCTNLYGQRPIELTPSYQVMKQLSGSTSTQHATKVFIIGSLPTESSSVIDAIGDFSAEKSNSTTPDFLSKLQSRTLGSVLFFNFSGQPQYYSRNASIIEKAGVRSSPLFLVLTDITQSSEKITQNVRLWVSFIETHCGNTQSPPRVIVVGNYTMTETVESSGELLEEKSTSVQNIFEASEISLHFAGFAALRSENPTPLELSTFSSLVSTACAATQEEQDLNFRCLALHNFLKEKFSSYSDSACKVSGIASAITLMDELLPHSLDHLFKLLSVLHSRQKIMFLSNQQAPIHSWVIVDKTVLLSEINHAVDLHLSGSQCFASSNGISSLSDLKQRFPNHDYDMFVSFLLATEYCCEVDLALLSVFQGSPLMPSPPNEEQYFFFPALLTAEASAAMWERSDEFVYQFGWCLLPIKHGFAIKEDHLLPRKFIRSLQLRLVRSFIQTSESFSPKHISVWRNGLYWVTGASIEAIVERQEGGYAASLMMRHKKGVESQFSQYRSAVIREILKVKVECHPLAEMQELLIHPKDLQYPMTSETLYSMKQIGTLFPSSQPKQITSLDMVAIGVDELIGLEPFSALSSQLLSRLFPEDSSTHLDQSLLTSLAEEVAPNVTLFQEMIDPSSQLVPEEGQSGPQRCLGLFQLWCRQQDGVATVRQFREELFDCCSIFCGRNPLSIGNVIDCDSLLPDTSTIFTGSNMKPIDITMIPDAQLSIKSLYEVNTEVVTVTKWIDLGLSLNLGPHTLHVIEANHPRDAVYCLTETLAAWLQKQGRAVPSWRAMAVALSSRAVGRKDLANGIAATYGINGATPDEGNSVGNTYLDVDNTQLDTESLFDVKQVVSLGTDWFRLGLALGLSYYTLEAIASTHRDILQCMTETLKAWMKKQDMVSERGGPSWRALAQALSSPLVGRPDIASLIADRHGVHT